MTYQWRNPKHTPWDTYEVEINHPEAGWIPYHVTPDDDVPSGQALWAEISSYTGTIAPSEVSKEDIASGDVRSARDRLLKDTDWTQLPDIPEATKELWSDYRQALRDVPAQPGFPMSIEWPVPPTQANTQTEGGN